MTERGKTSINILCIITCHILIFNKSFNVVENSTSSDAFVWKYFTLCFCRIGSGHSVCITLNRRKFSWPKMQAFVFKTWKWRKRNPLACFVVFRLTNSNMTSPQKFVTYPFLSKLSLKCVVCLASKKTYVLRYVYTYACIFNLNHISFVLLFNSRRQQIKKTFNFIFRSEINIENNN